MNNWVLGEPAGSVEDPRVDAILKIVASMESQDIHDLVTQIWLYYDDAVLRETGHLYNLGEGDPHWEGHL